MEITQQQLDLVNSIPFLIQQAQTPVSSGGSSVVYWYLNDSSVGSGGTIYCGAQGGGSTESAIIKTPIPLAGKISNFYVGSLTAQDTSGSFVITLRQNGNNTGITVTIPANTVAGWFSDTTHSITVAAGDLLDIKCVNNATTTSAALNALAFQLN